jgi:hypothetical protein
MPQFKNWLDTDETTELALYKRSIELRRLVEEVHVSARTNIDKSQQVQREVQDDNSPHIIPKSLESGTKVVVINPGIKGKLDSRYTGPYTIDGQAKNTNYWLKNAKGVRMKKSFPIDQLKILNEGVEELERDDEFEIENIVNDRVRNGLKEYLVKWKNYDDIHNTWVKETDFYTTECIQEYLENKQKKELIASVFVNNYMEYNKIIYHNWSAVIVITFLCLFVSYVQSTTLNGKFKYCSVSGNSPLLNTIDLCEEPDRGIVRRPEKYHILSKRSSIISGKGYLCTKTEIRITTYETFLSDTYKIEEKHHCMCLLKFVMN